MVRSAPVEKAEPNPSAATTVVAPARPSEIATAEVVGERTKHLRTLHVMLITACLASVALVGTLSSARRNAWLEIEELQRTLNWLAGVRDSTFALGEYFPTEVDAWRREFVGAGRFDSVLLPAERVAIRPRVASIAIDKTIEFQPLSTCLDHLASARWTVVRPSTLGLPSKSIDELLRSWSPPSAELRVGDRELIELNLQVGDETEVAGVFRTVVCASGYGQSVQRADIVYPPVSSSIDVDLPCTRVELELGHAWVEQRFRLLSKLPKELAASPLDRLRRELGPGPSALPGFGEGLVLVPADYLAFALPLAIFTLLLIMHAHVSELDRRTHPGSQPGIAVRDASEWLATSPTALARVMTIVSLVAIPTGTLALVMRGLVSDELQEPGRLVPVVCLLTSGLLAYRVVLLSERRCASSAAQP